MREIGGKEYLDKLMDAFKAARADHIAVYGPDNHMRLTGKHETASIDTFTWGVADRGASIRYRVVPVIGPAVAATRGRCR